MNNIVTSGQPVQLARSVISLRCVQYVSVWRALCFSSAIVKDSAWLSV